MIEVFGQARLDQLKIWREIKIPRHKKALVANMQDLLHTMQASGVFQIQCFDARQDRLLHRLKSLGDQRGANGTGRVPAAQ